LEKYVSTKPLLPFRRVKWKDFRTLKEEETKHEEGKKMETSCQDKTKARELSELYDSNQKDDLYGT
jgi:hypothetical protein